MKIKTRRRRISVENQNLTKRITRKLLLLIKLRKLVVMNMAFLGVVQSMPADSEILTFPLKFFNFLFDFSAFTLYTFASCVF